MTCSFVPPYLLEQIARPTPSAPPRAIATLTVDALLRDQRASTPAPRPTPTAVARRGCRRPRLDRAHRPQHHDAARARPCARGRPGVRRRRGRRGGRRHRRRRCALFAEVFGRDVLRRRGRRRSSLTVHYERDYDNAFWDGTQLVFGDGDGEIFDRFTKPVDVLGHEFTHAVTEHTAGLRLPGPVRRAQRVGLRRLRHLPQAAAARPERRRRPTGWSAQGSSCPASRPGRLRDMAAPRHGLRRPARSARTRRSATWTTTSTPPTTTAASTSTPASPTAPSTSRRPRSAARRGRAPAGSGTPPSPAARSRADDRLRRLRRRDRRGGRRARRRGRARPGRRSGVDPWPAGVDHRHRRSPAPARPRRPRAADRRLRRPHRRGLGRPRVRTTPACPSVARPGRPDRPRATWPAATRTPTCSSTPSSSAADRAHGARAAPHRRPAPRWPTCVLEAGDPAC